MSKNIKFKRKKWLFVLLFTVATAVGVTLASPFILIVIITIGMGGGFEIAFGMGGGFENASTYIGLFTLAGFILGTIIGFGQTLALIGQAKQRILFILWIPASILGGTLGGLIVGSLGKIALILNITMPGIAIGIAQQFVLMKSLKKATVWGWIPVNIIAWIVAQFLFFAGISFSQLNPVTA